MKTTIDELLVKCSLEPQHIDDNDIEDMVQYALTLDNIQLANFIQEISRFEKSIWETVITDPRIMEHAENLIAEQNERTSAIAMWGRRPSGIN